MFTYKIDEETSLKLIEHKDAEELFELSDLSRDHLRVWLPWIDFTHSVEDTKKFIHGCLERYARNNGLTVCILSKGKIAGVVDFHEINWAHKRTSIGYWMGAEYTGRGLLTKACRHLFTYAFEELRLNRIEIRAAEENSKSRAIPERLGFVQEGMIRDAANMYGSYVNHVVYGMLARDWFSDRSS
ncbi:ribosomal-protein-serine acetyltransferase [Halobacillus alkaliphilus]|uniref:Ribosomal-protein-serine acetyltransferase n=1 Tax=Halobacillus alkaliphilus TaxID=396056 RepID=A0A1I2SVF9_9BACI|nr:GNAT family protein [Halobacillus alkaliphilus]SFG56588.1 ribosomal-protein-serine acetyltransferase [Halobacillus alkaliphilus]